MRGDVVFRVYGLHEERDADSFFGAFRSRAEADAQIAELAARTMHGENWGRPIHNRGFVVREHQVQSPVHAAHKATISKGISSLKLDGDPLGSHCFSMRLSTLLSGTPPRTLGVDHDHQLEGARVSFDV